MILSIETSDVWCSVAFWDEQSERTLLELNLEIPAQHAALLASVVQSGQEYIQKFIRGLAPFEEQISLTAVSVGPGSFTGLRIGLSFAQGFCFARNIPVVGISNHQILATQMKPCDQQQFTMIDARREEMYMAKIRYDSDNFPQIEEHSIVRKEKLPEVIPPGSLLIKPEFHNLDSEIIKNLRVKGVVLHGKGSYPAHILAKLGYQKLQKFGADDFKTLEPLYIRPFAGVL